MFPAGMRLASELGGSVRADLQQRVEVNRVYGLVFPKAWPGEARALSNSMVLSKRWAMRVAC